jgi:Copper transport outer membrane protein, MctB
MLDFRYHALSLAAVLCALAVGVLVGVAIGDSSLVSSAQDGLVHNLRGEVRATQRNLELAGQRLSEQQSLVTSFWPLAVRDLLAGRSVGIVFLGESSNEVDSLVRDGVKEAGGEVKSLVAVREPTQTVALGIVPARSSRAGSGAEAKLIRHFGVRIGRELVAGGRLIEHVRSKLLSSYDGQLGGLEGVVVMRSEPAGMSLQATQQTHELESGLIAGIEAEGVSAVGVETTSTEPSQVPWYKAEGLSSVDDIENVGGRAALAFALAGYRGAFGNKSSADAQLPSAASAPAGAAGHP